MSEKRAESSGRGAIGGRTAVLLRSPAVKTRGEVHGA